MRVYGFILIFGLGSAPSPGVGEERPRTLRPFVTDGCSALFGNSNKEWTSCCVEHDFAYWVGGTPDQKRGADDRLAECFKSKGKSGILPAGAWSTPFARRRSQDRWGTGWQPRRPQTALNAQEWAEVERSQEIFALRQPIVSGTDPKDCDPQVRQSMAAMSSLTANAGLTCFTLAFSGLGVKEWLIYSPECSGFFILQIKKFSSGPNLYGYGDCDVSPRALSDPQRPASPRCPWSEGNLLDIYHVQKALLAAIR